jgi:hypothetical protein
MKLGDVSGSHDNEYGDGFFNDAPCSLVDTELHFNVVSPNDGGRKLV